MVPLALYGVVVTYETLISACFYRKCESLDLTCLTCFIAIKISLCCNN